MPDRVASNGPQLRRLIRRHAGPQSLRAVVRRRPADVGRDACSVCGHEHPRRDGFCGLFENCGVAVLLIYAPGYSRSLAQIEAAPNPQELERTQYGLDHTVIGDALVRTWGLSEEVAQAVRYHHDLLRLDTLKLPEESRKLVALSAAVTEVFARSAGRRRDEWTTECDAAAAVLGWTPADLEARVEDLLS